MQVEDFAFMGLGFEVCMPKGSFEVAPSPQISFNITYIYHIYT